MGATCDPTLVGSQRPLHNLMWALILLCKLDYSFMLALPQTRKFVAPLSHLALNPAAPCHQQMQLSASLQLKPLACVVSAEAYRW